MQKNIVINGTQQIGIVSGEQGAAISNQDASVSIGGTTVSIGAKKTTEITAGKEVSSTSKKVSTNGLEYVIIDGGLVKINS